MRLAIDLLKAFRARHGVRGAIARLVDRALDRVVGPPGEVREPPTDPARARRTADAFRAHTAAYRARRPHA